MATKIVNSLAGLPAEVTVKKLVHRSNYDELWISFPKSERICPHCGSHDCTIKDSGVSESIVYSILDLISFDTVSKLPETIAIDEFKGNSGIWDSDRHRWLKGKYHTNIVNGDGRSVIDVLPVIRAADLKKYFRHFPKSERDQGQNQRFALQEFLRNSKHNSSTLQHQ